MIIFIRGLYTTISDAPQNADISLLKFYIELMQDSGGIVYTQYDYKSLLKSVCKLTNNRRTL